jgi:hypothetical protein
LRHNDISVCLSFFKLTVSFLDQKKGLLESRPLFDFDLIQNYSAAGASAAGAASAGAASAGAASTGAASGAACSVVVASAGAATSSFLLQATARTIRAAARNKNLDIKSPFCDSSNLRIIDDS